MRLDLAPETLVVAAIMVPFLAALTLPFYHRMPNLRETVTLIAAGCLAWIVWSLVGPIMAGARPEVVAFTIMPGLVLAFRVEPLGMLFALVAGTLWLVNSIYSIGYMRGNDEPRQTSFYVFFAIALSATMGIAFASNLFTLFIFYEVLTLSTYPLVAHKASKEAMKGARVYLLILIGTSMIFLLPAIIMTGIYAGTLDFTPGGILAGKVSPTVMALLLALFAFGIGKAALMPFHFWLPTAMVAPTPVSALLHAVAVVKAGVFTVLKVVIYIFGLETLTSTGASQWLTYAAAFTLIAASLVALRQDNLKARLAYSTVSQLSYIVLGAMLVTHFSVIGGALHIAMHAAGKITLFFCAGAIYVAAHKTEIRQLDGIGYRMPVTMSAYFIGALCVIGIPPTGAIWSKWHLVVGAYQSEYAFAVAVFLLSTILNVAYLLPPVIRAFLLPSKDPHDSEIQEAPLPCLIAICITATMCIALFFGAGAILELLAPITSTQAWPK